MPTSQGSSTPTLPGGWLRGPLRFTRSGSLSSGPAAFAQGPGFWLGLDPASGLGRFSLAGSGGDHLTWDGQSLSLAGRVAPTAGMGLRTAEIQAPFAAWTRLGVLQVSPPGGFSGVLLISLCTRGPAGQGSGLFTASWAGDRVDTALLCCSLQGLTALELNLTAAPQTASLSLDARQSNPLAASQAISCSASLLASCEPGQSIRFAG